MLSQGSRMHKGSRFCCPHLWTKCFVRDCAQLKPFLCLLLRCKLWHKDMPVRVCLITSPIWLKLGNGRWQSSHVVAIYFASWGLLLVFFFAKGSFILKPCNLIYHSKLSLAFQHPLACCFFHCLSGLSLCHEVLVLFSILSVVSPLLQFGLKVSCRIFCVSMFIKMNLRRLGKDWSQ